MEYVIPSNLDVTSPVFLDIHFLVAKHSDTVAPNLNVQLQLDADYRANLGELGTAGGGSFSQTLLTGDFAVTEPSVQHDLIHQVVTIQLNPALMADSDWGYFSIFRIAPSTTEYPHKIYLSAVAVRYTSTCAIGG